MSHVEQMYHKRIDAMSPKERVALAAEMLQWSRQAIARQITADAGPMSDERLKWLVAMRQYGAEPTTRAMIEKVLERVPH